jgi:hypothetical protein
MSVRNGLLIAALVLLAVLPAAARSQGRLVHARVASESIRHNVIGVSAERGVTVYLPEGYDGGTGRYPVVYYLHNLFEDDRTLYARYDAKALFDRAIRDRVVPGVIVVSADFGTPLGGSLYTNSAVTGNWEDFLVRELVPYVDATYRTLASVASRGLAGDRMGGYGAIRIAMRHPDVFGSVYALHPVGTGSGLQIMYSRPNWGLVSRATSADDLKDDVFSQIFTAIFQAHLPNRDKPPLYVDLPARLVGGRLMVDAALTERLHASFFLERQVPRYAERLRSLRGLKLDWGRSDANQDHVYSNQAFTRKLDEFGVPHEAEEYRGGWGDRHWGEDGRVMTDVLPFFAKHLDFGASADAVPAQGRTRGPAAPGAAGPRRNRLVGGGRLELPSLGF